jgi:hypothetical protein
MRSRRYVLVLFWVLLGGSAAAAALAGDVPLRNWYAPKFWVRPPAAGSHGSKGLLTDAGPPLAFVPLAPCRIADTRGFGFTGQAGPPSLVANVDRVFQIGGSVPGVTTQCGIPADAYAVSFNFAVTNIVASGNLIAFPAGGTAPTVSSLNWQPGFAALSNAAIVALGSGRLDVRVNGTGTVDLIIDVNGYYAPDSAAGATFFSLVNNSNIYTMGLLNTSTSCTGDCGLQVETASGSAIFGVADGPGNVYGVWGRAGVASLSPYASSTGVLGEGTQRGVVGLAPSGGYAVAGYRLDSGGNVLSGGLFGAGDSTGLYVYGDTGATGTKGFVEPHPTDASRVIRYVSLEGPEAGTYFRGRGRFVQGRALVTVPESFRLVTDEEGLTVQVTPIGAMATCGHPGRPERDRARGVARRRVLLPRPGGPADVPGLPARPGRGRSFPPGRAGRAHAGCVQRRAEAKADRERHVQPGRHGQHVDRGAPGLDESLGYSKYPLTSTITWAFPFGI